MVDSSEQRHLPPNLPDHPTPDQLPANMSIEQYLAETFEYCIRIMPITDADEELVENPTFIANQAAQKSFFVLYFDDDQVIHFAELGTLSDKFEFTQDSVRALKAEHQEMKMLVLTADLGESRNSVVVEENGEMVQLGPVYSGPYLTADTEYWMVSMPLSR